jgi:2'-5' RNA ligase
VSRGSAAAGGGDRRTALVVVVPEAEQLVRVFRARYHADSVARGIPPHVTVLFPFAPAREFGRERAAAVRALAGGATAFEARLTRVATFDDGHVWLEPAPRERFVRLIRAASAAFPCFPRYGGAHAAPVPHLTVGQAGSQRELSLVEAAARQELGSGLPLEFRVEELTLLEELPDGSWRPARRFPLANG